MSERTSIDEIKNFAKLKGGYLLSKNYTNNKEILFWKCNCGEEWESSWSNLKAKNAWCPKCLKRKTSKNRNTYNIEYFKKLAIFKNGLCLSDKYINCNEKLEFQCKLGHIWKAKPSNIVNSNTWCPICNHISPVSIEDMQNLAKKKNGECLSNKYINGGIKLLWRCDKGHEWMSIPESIHSGSWCPICANKNIPLTIREMQEIAKKRNGECLSETYINSKTKLLWKCENNHQWMATPTNIKSGKWCPFCKLSQGEKIINEYLIKNSIIFEREKRFDKCKNNRKLPFDFYLPKQNICIEYDGEQHFKPIRFNSCSNEYANKLLLRVKQNDAIKNEYCTDNNIRLIRIPYTTNNIEEFLNKFI